MKYSASQNGFYLPEIHGEAIPADAVDVTQEEHRALLQGQSAGRTIQPDQDGRPVLFDAPEPTPAELLAAERAAMRCSRFQARAALHLSGLLALVEDAVSEADPIVQIAWNDAVEFQRTSPTIAALAAAVNLTDEQIDDLFRAAAQIVA